MWSVGTAGFRQAPARCSRLPLDRPKEEVKGRWHDNRHTLVTELAEGGSGDEVIMSIAGHVSRAMLSQYSHVRMEAKRRALDTEPDHSRGRVLHIACGIDKRRSPLSEKGLQSERRSKGRDGRPSHSPFEERRDEIAVRQRAADERREQDAAGQQAALPPQPAVVQ